MRKTYPYLQDSYIYNSNKEARKRNFLAKIDNFVNQRQYVNITLLTWEEDPIKSIEGEITSGSISKNGSSSVRTTCSLTCNVSYGEYDIDKMESDFAINKKIFVEIGVKNDSNEYLDYPILWFPQGVFFISSFSASSSSSGSVSISLSLKDKMAGLNGEIGGTFPALMELDTMTTQLPSGDEVQQKVLIYNLIQELVNHWGQEDLNNIVIEDIPLRIRRVVKWNADNPVYRAIVANGNTKNKENQKLESNPDPHYDDYEVGDGVIGYQFTLYKPSKVDYQEFNKGDDVGYILTDFVMPNELTANAGESVTSVLDKIKQTLGNYEYFYDEFGIFHFREIKNYQNTTQGKLALQETSENQYLIENNNSRSIYTFDDVANIISINVTPHYDNIKNDYVILGLKEDTTTNVSFQIRYHLAIDEKPESFQDPQVGLYYGGAYGSSPDEMLIIFSEKDILGNYTGNFIAQFAKKVDTLPDVGNFNQLYFVGDEKTKKWNAYYWNQDNIYEEVHYYDDTITDSNKKEQSPILYAGGNSGWSGDKGLYYPKDWRTFLLLKGKLAAVNGLDTGYYYEELNANWHTIYNLKDQHFWGEKADDSVTWRTLTEGNYYLDFINAPTSSLGKYGVQTIGRRSDVVSNDKINCLFQPEIPDVNFLNIDELGFNTSDNTSAPHYVTLAEQRKESIDNGQDYTQVGNEIYSNLVTGGYHNAAYDQIKYELYLHTRFQRNVSLTTFPIFYLAPNTRITICEKSTNTFGDFVIDSLNFNLGAGSTMSISAKEIYERE